MYMAPIARTRPAAPFGVRSIAGTATLVLATLVMVPWLALIACGTALVLGVKLLAALPRAARAAIDYAGEIALGR